MGTQASATGRGVVVDFSRGGVTMLRARSAVLALLCLPTALLAQRPRGESDPWTVRVRATISGASYESQPADYKIYSGVSLEAAIERRLGSIAALELSGRTESREVLGPASTGADERLGSIEMLPLTLLLRWLPLGRSNAAFQPYLGGGAALIATWEKSGVLDSTDVPASLRPALGLGADYVLSDRLVLNLDVKWNPLTARITNFRSPDPTVKIDPMTVGLGMGVRF